MENIVKNELAGIHRCISKGIASNDTFLSGNLGLTYYYYTLYTVSEKDEHLTTGRTLLERVFYNLNTGDPGITGPSFSKGAAGLAYITNALVQDNLLDMDMEKEFADMDKFLFDEANAQIENDYIDCLHGAFSIIHYFAEREINTAANKYLNLLVEKVCSRAVKAPDGYWFRNYILQVTDLEEINFSLSHGLSGMLLILIKAYEKSARKDLIREMVIQGIRFISRHQLVIDSANEEYSFYPFSVKINATEIENRPRMAWCYGDLNQVLLFYRAGKLFGDQELVRLAELVGMHSLTRKNVNSTRVTDSHFCHGSSGLAQFYKVLYAESGNKKYLEGYEFWIEQTVLLLQKDMQKGLYKGKEHEFLEGLVGVAFTLLSYTSDKKLNWSKGLLL
jgi:lantibiotic modifying enzyme